MILIVYNKWKQGYVLEQQEHPRDYTWSQKKMYYHILKERLHQEYVKKQDHKLIEMKQNDYQKFVQEFAQDKMVDLNCFTIESAMSMVAGTARSMGIAVKGDFPGNN